MTNKKIFTKTLTHKEILLNLARYETLQLPENFHCEDTDIMHVEFTDNFEVELWITSKTEETQNN